MLVPVPAILSLTALVRGSSSSKTAYPSDILSSGTLKGLIAPVQLPLWASLENASSQGSYILERVILQRLSCQRGQITVKILLSSFLSNSMASSPPHTLIHMIDGPCPHSTFWKPKGTSVLISSILQ
ncbi:hypothetical protein HJG60_009704 [Phyllostomus discolor]|uniref:Uncharacterized protein n=1 Tax=Phyllostomus discolor TaxID=89673 RepID=A0A834EQ60_9CHIR|nr:hypothetical protein HJG60_009704 [Phyllostomus discolor]